MTGDETLPSLDLVFPTINRPAELHRLLESTVAQSYPRLRAVVVDMNQEDASAATILEDFSDTLEIVHLRASPRGVSMARNLGIRRIQAELVSLTDDDCWYPQGLLRTIGARFAREPDLAGLSIMQVDERFRPSNGRWARRGGPDHEDERVGSGSRGRHVPPIVGARGGRAV